LAIRQAHRFEIRALTTSTLVLFLLVVSGCGSLSSVPGVGELFGEDESELFADPTAQAGVDYEISVKGLGVGDNPDETAENLRMLEIVKSQARVFKLQEKPPPSVALLKRRAAADVALVERALKSEGYYEGTAIISVDDKEKPIPGTEEDTPVVVEEPDNDDQERPRPIFNDIADPDVPPIVNIFVRKGPRYALARQGVQIEPAVSPEITERVQEAVAQNVGGPAQGRAVVDAEQAALGELNRVGRPYAKKGKRRAEANFDLDTLDVVTTLDAGPFTVYGDTKITGLREVEEAYIRDFITWKKGEPVSRADLRAAQRQLAGTQLFGSITVEIPSEPPEDLAEGETFFAPVLITTEEGKHRTISGGASFSSEDGPGLRAKWEHRNLFGQNEQFSVEAEADTNRQSLDLTYTKPRYSKITRDLVGNLELFREDEDAFDALGATGSLAITEQFNPNLKGSLGIGFEAAQIKEDDETNESYIFGLPASLAYDDTNDLLDPTIGVRATAAVAPWAGLFDGDKTAFLVTDLHGSTYIPFDRDHKYVLALRGRAAAVFAESSERVPTNRRLFSGGGGSVRGFETQAVGPLGDDGDPVGGLTAAEIGIEGRLRFGNIGVVPFVDAGLVSQELFSEYDEIRVGAGLGLRYHSPVGPIRLDVGFPLNRRGRDPDFQFYISIGQAF